MAKDALRGAAVPAGGRQTAALRSEPKHAARPAPETIRIEALKAAIELRSGSSNADSITRTAAQLERWIVNGSEPGEGGA